MFISAEEVMFFCSSLCDHFPFFTIRGLGHKLIFCSTTSQQVMSGLQWNFAEAIYCYLRFILWLLIIFVLL